MTCGNCGKSDCRCRDRAVLTEFVRWLTENKKAVIEVDMVVERHSFGETIARVDLPLSYLLEEFLK